MTRIENTTKRTPAEHVIGMLGGSTPYIEGMEAAGQRELVNSTVLPTDCRDEEAFLALGFEFGEPVKGDEMFRDAKLPEGWSREGSDHAMWSYIVDEKGYRRVSIFYKAAFYDRSAHMGIVRVPKTAAQANAYKDADPPTDLFMHHEDRREGDNYVYSFRGRYGENAPEDKHAYSDDGRRYETVVAPDGSIVERREFTAEP